LLACRFCGQRLRCCTSGGESVHFSNYSTTNTTTRRLRIDEKEEWWKLWLMLSNNLDSLRERCLT
jgi:hypothetical protein